MFFRHLKTIFALLKFNLLHVLRYRLLVLMFAFSFLIQFVALKIMHAASINVEGVIFPIGPVRTLFLALFFQFFLGIFLSIVYGVWMVPYLHKGGRALVTYSLPVPKGAYLWAYGLTLLVLVFCQHCILLANYGFLFGFGSFFQETFPWRDFLGCLFLETVAFLACMYGLAVSSMTIGQIATLFLGAGTFFILQVFGGLSRIDAVQQFASTRPGLHWIMQIYTWLPPIGEMIFDLKDGFFLHLSVSYSVLKWSVWALLLAFILYWRLCFPKMTRTTSES